MNSIVPDADYMRQLHQQIEDFYKRFQNICHETSGMIEDPRMPDAAQQLQGVLSETERAAHTILSAGTAINGLVSTVTVPDEVKHQVQEQITLIYEASGFQDISGQRIQKVLRSLQELEAQLGNLAKVARGETPVGNLDKSPGDPLLNGPQLKEAAPSQADIDALFN